MGEAFETGTLQVRPATVADADAVRQLLAGFSRLHHRWEPAIFRPRVLGVTPALFRTWLDTPGEHHLVAVLGGRVVGYAFFGEQSGQYANDFMFSRRGLWIFVLYVDAAVRRQGVARALLAAVERFGEEYGAEAIGLNVFPGNDTARAFYEAQGYLVGGESRRKTLRQVTRIEGRDD